MSLPKREEIQLPVNRAVDRFQLRQITERSRFQSFESCKVSKEMNVKAMAHSNLKLF